MTRDSLSNVVCEGIPGSTVSKTYKSMAGHYNIFEILFMGVR